MTLGRDTAAYGDIRNSLTTILRGVVIAIDPSIGSSSSMPGWALYRAGALISSGTLGINPDQSVWKRLRDLARAMRSLYKETDPDVLVYEEIPSQRYGGGGNANAHASLLKAVGVILSIPGPDVCVGLHPLSWKKMVRETYVKGDEADAVEMGWIAIAEAARIAETNPPGAYGKKKKQERK